MYRRTIAIIDKYKQYFPVIVKLLGSGLLTSLGFVLLSSGKFDYISNDLSVKILLFIQFQIIGITISKYGLDSLVFAKMIGDSNSVYDPLEYIKKKGILLSILCAGVYAVMYDYTYALVILCTIVFDVYSVVAIVQMNVMKHYNYAFFANIAAYPLFFGVLLVSSLFFEYSYGQMIALYVACIFLRFLLSWVFIMKKKKTENIELMKLEVPFSLGIQQILNFSLFKIDQIIILLGAVLLVFFGIMGQDIQQILFLSKFPELVSGVLVSLSFLYAPYLIIESREGLIAVLNKYKWILVLYSVGMAVALWVYTLIWRGEADFLDIVYAVSYFIVSVLAVFVNMVTLGYLKKNEVNILVKNLVISSGIGIVFLLIIPFLGMGRYMVCCVPIQMLFFLALRLQNKK
jgi:membrane protein